MNPSSIRTDRVFRREPESDEVGKRLRPEDVATPTTLALADAACDLASTKIEALEHQRARNPHRADDFDHALIIWGERLAELEYARERLRAGEAPPSMELAQARAQVEALERTVAKLQRRPAPDPVQGTPFDRNALREAQDAVRKRDATIERLTRERDEGFARRDAKLARVRAETPRPVEERARRTQEVQDVSAMALEALDSFVNGGAAWTPLGRLVARRLEARLPEGYRASWQRTVRPHLDLTLSLAEAEPEGVGAVA
jgi:hypothetical protein